MRKSDCITYIKTGRLPGHPKDEKPAKDEPKARDPKREPKAGTPDDKRDSKLAKIDPTKLGPIEAAIYNFLKEVGIDTQPEIDTEEIALSVAELLEDKIKPDPTEIVVYDENGEKGRTKGATHYAFPLLVRIVNARLTSGEMLAVWMYGDSGTGKSKTAEILAETFKLRFADISCNREMRKGDLFGYVSMLDHEYKTTPFREMFENGGLFLADEWDKVDPNLAAVVNNGLANGYMTFPDGKRVKMHPKFVFMVGANTTGGGRTQKFTSSVRQDAAMLDRFVYVSHEIDEGLESSILAQKYGIDINSDTLKAFRDDITPKHIDLSSGKKFTPEIGAEFYAYVLKARRALANHANKDNYVISMRSAIQGIPLLQQRVPFELVCDMTVYKGMPESVRESLKRAVSAM